MYNNNVFRRTSMKMKNFFIDGKTLVMIKLKVRKQCGTKMKTRFACVESSKLFWITNSDTHTHT